MSRLLGAADVRRIATELDIRPTKKWGQNFVIDPNTVERIVRVANVSRHDVVVEVGPGLGSLTLALLRLLTVSGRACTMYSLPLSPSLAHSMSIGRW